jgi:tetratricopeptide (TPR) repeat protein
VLRAAAGLERVQRFDAATVAYAAILRRWPDNLGAAIGLGNARHAAGNLPGAESAFRAAVKQHPEAAAAWNNLAQVLAERGQRQEAIRAAQEAVTRGGAAADQYRATLQEISKPAP